LRVQLKTELVRYPVSYFVLHNINDVNQSITGDARSTVFSLHPPKNMGRITKKSFKDFLISSMKFFAIATFSFAVTSEA